MTILACTSIVITAVYILRVVGKLLYGKVVNEHHLALTDAVWYERLTAIVLIAAIARDRACPSLALGYDKQQYGTHNNELVPIT